VLKPDFTSKIDLGHLIQAGILLVTVGGGGIGGYLALDDRISAQAAKLGIVEQQITQQDHTAIQIQSEQRRFADSISLSLAKLSDQLADLRVLVAKEKR